MSVSKKPKGFASIEPDHLYHYEDAARILKKSPRWLKENLIWTGEIDVAILGDTYVIPGYVLFDYAVRNLVTWQKGNSTSSKKGITQCRASARKT